DVLLDPEVAYAEAQRLAEAQGERLTVSKNQLQRRLKEEKLLVSTEGQKTTTRRTIEGKGRAGLHVPARPPPSHGQGAQGGWGGRVGKPGQFPRFGPPVWTGAVPNQGAETGGISRKTGGRRAVPPVPPVSGMGIGVAGSVNNKGRR